MFTIRLAGIEDIDDIIELRMAFLREMQPDACAAEDEVRQLTSEYIAQNLPSGELLVWLAEEDGRIIGTGALVFFHRPPSLRNPFTHHAYVVNMYTVAEHRKRGVGTAILHSIVEYVKTTPARRVSLHATKMGRPVYEKYGFTASNEDMYLRL